MKVYKVYYGNKSMDYGYVEGYTVVGYYLRKERAEEEAGKYKNGNYNTEGRIEEIEVEE